MEISNSNHSDAESVADHDPGFDFLTKQSVNSNSFFELDRENRFTEQSVNHGDVVVVDEDEGFRTPTSMERKIKMIETCPPAPRKPPPPPPSRKRKALFPVDQSAMLAEFSPGKKARVFTVTAQAKVMQVFVDCSYPSSIRRRV
ncbi:hypothetical protein QQ045_018119 [Rhodiola kirilowii]